MKTYRVDIPVMLTLEVECHDLASARHAIDEAFHPAMASDPLTGHRFRLEHGLVLPNEAKICMVVATDTAEAWPS